MYDGKIRKQAADELGSAVGLVEKDRHVVRAVAALSGLDAAPMRLVFGGGTALARVHKTIRRMSEDVDFKVMPLENGAVCRQSAIGRMLGELREKVSRALKDSGFSHGSVDAAYAQRATVHAL